MRILIATDAFPPDSGGSGWSTYELARGLRARGHDILVVQTYRERARVPAGYDGFEVLGYPALAPGVPFVRNYVRNERLYPRLASRLAGLIRSEKIDLVHGQHVLTGPAAVVAGRDAGVASVCTVRDYWPLCYWNDLLVDPEKGTPCAGCSASAMTTCVRPRAGYAWPAALPLIPYMRANLHFKQRTLAHADAIVAVSHRVADDLRRRSAELACARVETIPNGVDVRAVRAEVENSQPPLQGPYMLFVGKLAQNKGVQWLVEVAGRVRQMPLVVIGDGPERASLAAAAAGAQCDVRLLGWRSRAEVFRWMRHALLLVFPSNCPETLSRVLIEASALGLAIAAMDTGGTTDIVVNEETGLLSTSVIGLAADVERLANDPDLRTRLGAAAAERAASRFDSPVVVSRMESLYQELIASHR